MCKNNKRIVNKTRRPVDYATKVFLDVPCGYCKDCTSQKIQDWTVRSSAEFERVRKTGGFVWFPTLTYDNDNLYFWTEDGMNIPCFCKEHFVSFRNKLRVYLKRAGYDFSGDNTIRYFYVTEYGTNTGRPHIHCLLFVPRFIDFNLFRQLVKKSWIYGYVGYSNKGATVDSMKAVQYTMKYLSKPVAWFRRYGIDEYLYKLKSDYISENDVHKRSYYEAKYKAFKCHLPHHCQSMGFGSTLEITDEQFINNEISSSSVGLYDSMFTYRVPQYYYRKYLYDYDKFEKLFTMNERGKYIAQKRFSKLVQSLMRVLDEKMFSSYYDDLSRIVGDINIIPCYHDFVKLKDYDLEFVANYILGFRDVPVYSSVFEDLNNADFDDVCKYIIDNSYYYYCARRDVKAVKPLPPGLKPFIKADDILLFNYLSQLRVIENALNFMEIADKMIAQKNIDAYYETLYRENVQFKNV